MFIIRSRVTFFLAPYRSRSDLCCLNLKRSRSSLLRDENISFFQVTFRAAQADPWRRSTPGSISCRDKCPRWSIQWPVIFGWFWVCSNRPLTRRGTARASRWCREPRRSARGRAAEHRRWSRDRRASRNLRQFRRATETERSSPARRTVCSGKNENVVSRTYVKFQLPISRLWLINRIVLVSRALILDVKKKKWFRDK